MKIKLGKSEVLLPSFVVLIQNNGFEIIRTDHAIYCNVATFSKIRAITSAPGSGTFLNISSDR
jgi:hypothetical protein